MIVIRVLAMITGTTSTILQDNLMDMSGMGDHQEKMEDLKSAAKPQRNARSRSEDRSKRSRREPCRPDRGSSIAVPTDGVDHAGQHPAVRLALLEVFGAGVDASLGEYAPHRRQGRSWSEGVAGPMQAWIVWYFLCSMAFTQIIRKALDVETPPTR